MLHLLDVVGAACGMTRLGSLSFVAVPSQAETTHTILFYCALYLLAGAQASESVSLDSSPWA